MDIKLYGAALAASLLAWIAGHAKPRNIDFIASWLGWKQNLLVMALAATVSLGAGAIGMAFVVLIDRPDDTLHWLFRGVVGGALGQAAVRVQLNKVPTVGTSLSLLGKAMEWVDELRATLLDKAQFRKIRALTGTQLVKAASTIQQTRFATDTSIDVSVRDSVTKNLQTRIEISRAAATREEKEDSIEALQNYLIVITPVYEIHYRYLDPKTR